jgi:hypothetical protein
MAVVKEGGKEEKRRPGEKLLSPIFPSSAPTETENLEKGGHAMRPKANRGKDDSFLLTISTENTKLRR